jgi:hypothetical protein
MSPTSAVSRQLNVWLPQRNPTLINSSVPLIIAEITSAVIKFYLPMVEESKILSVAPTHKINIHD